MSKKKKLKLKKFYLHPITTMLLMILLIVLLSALLSLFNISSNFRTVGLFSSKVTVEQVAIRSLLTRSGMQAIFTNAIYNLGNFRLLFYLIVSFIGIAISKATGFLDAVYDRIFKKMSNFSFTFLFIFLSSVASIINDISLVIIIPLAAIFFKKKRGSSTLGIVVSYAAHAFTRSISVFTGSMEMNLVPLTEIAAKIIDNEAHVAMLSNVFAIMISTVVVSIVATFVTEKILSKKFKKEKLEDTIALDSLESAQKEALSKKGFRNAFIYAILVLLFLIYAIIPGLPGSGLFLDLNTNGYMYQLLGENSKFTSGFSITIMLLLAGSGIIYGISAKTIKNDKELWEKTGKELKHLGYILLIIFVYVEMIAIFKATNFDLVVTSLLASILNNVRFSGLPLILVFMLFVFISGLLLPSPTIKWAIFSPVAVPLFMQANISSEFAQFVFRAADSMACRFSIFFEGFIIYLIYLNLYNKKNEPVTFRESLEYLRPLGIAFAVTWVSIVIIFYLLNIPIGIGVSPII